MQNVLYETYNNEDLLELPVLLLDFYKLSHREQYPKNTEYVYSTWTPRNSRNKNFKGVVAFGYQAFIKEYLITAFNKYFFKLPKDIVVNNYKEVLYFTLVNPGNIQGVPEENLSQEIAKVQSKHIEDLHDLQYLPIKIKALKEGVVTPIRVPQLTIENTDPRFFWLTNALETLFSNEVWMPSTSATISKMYHEILTKYAQETVGTLEGVEYQAHDFSMRGMSTLNASKASGAGHLLSFVGTDTLPAIHYLRKYYNADYTKEILGTSIPATEHSVMCSYGQENELDLFKHLLTNVYPSGIFSAVSDAYDFWKVVAEYLPQLKDIIMQRDGKLVIRPDSGNPVDIICGEYIPDLTDPRYPTTTPEDMLDHFKDELYKMDLCGDGYTGDDQYTFKFKLNDKYYKMTIDIEYNRHDKRYYYIDYVRLKKVEEFTPTPQELGLIESLWNIFKGTVTKTGYKLLDPHIGAIYGDSITLERAEEICQRLKEKGFASINIVLGIGSFSFQYNTRDTFGFALKSTHIVAEGVERKIFKDPKTDNGIKKSQRGKVIVTEQDGKIQFLDNLDNKQYQAHQHLDILEEVFVDGKLVRDDTLQDIRTRLKAYTVT